VQSIREEKALHEVRVLTEDLFLMSFCQSYSNLKINMGNRGITEAFFKRSKKHDYYCVLLLVQNFRLLFAGNLGINYIAAFNYTIIYDFIEHVKIWLRIKRSELG